MQQSLLMVRSNNVLVRATVGVVSVKFLNFSVALMGGGGAEGHPSAPPLKSPAPLHFPLPLWANRDAVMKAKQKQQEQAAGIKGMPNNANP